MRSTAFSLTAFTLLAVTATSATADSVTIPNTFAAGDRAVAADVNENFDAVADAVNDNDARITTNTADIADNTAAITTNTNDIATNAAAIATSGAAITTNTNNIATNAAAITANTNDIAANAADIATNTADIATNAADIATNTADIATNAAAIATNTSNITNLQQNGNRTGVACAGNDAGDEMVRVGPLCVDVYEASVWDTSAGGVTQYGTTAGGDDYPCSDNGNDCSVGAANPIYARSEAGVEPSRSITWFQAQQACASSGKRLLTNAEWQMAVAGTPDPTAAGDDGLTTCAVNGAGVANTDGRSACVSNWGTENMIGNVAEWVADWIQGGNEGAPGWTPSAYPGTTNAAYNNDGSIGVNEAQFQGNGNDLPAALVRGGDFGDGDAAGAFFVYADIAPSFSGNAIGFRCAR